MLESYSELISERPVGMGGAGEIPWSKIRRYADYLEITDVEDFEYFKVLIRSMDRAELKAVREKSKTK